MKIFIIGGLTEEIQDYKFKNACEKIGEKISKLGYSLVICSPFEDSADYWVLKGFIKANPSESQSIDLIHVDSNEINSKIANIRNSISHKNINIQPIITSSLKEDPSYIWLLCQLQALETCQAVVSIGGKNDGAANMLLILAESKRKKYYLFPFSVEQLYFLMKDYVIS